MFRILVVGTAKRKNIDLIYDIVKELNYINFTFIGKFDNILNCVNLECFENVSEKELIAFYENSDALLFPSLSEGFGIPIIEAQYFGVPVITSNKEPMKSVAGENGAVLVNPKSKDEIIKAILHLKENESLRQILIENGKANVQNYTIDSIVKKYDELYKSI